VSKLAKYGIRGDEREREWRITVLYDVGEGHRYLAVHGGRHELIECINELKTTLGDGPGGAFYVNEYRHVLVPVADTSGTGTGSHYYCAGRLEEDFAFEFQGQLLTTKPIRPDGSLLEPGDPWVGPRPGIPYVLSAGGGDIYYETPALTDDDPPRVRPRMTRQVRLSRVLGDKGALARAVAPVAKIRGHRGGRFYVNEHGALFTPVGAGDGNGINYIYCGQIDPDAWFPEPPLDDWATSCGGGDDGSGT